MLYRIFNGVFRVALPASNAWLLVKDSDAILIDNGTRRDRWRLLSLFKREYSGNLKLHSILQTHGHCDHAGNMAFLATRFGARIHAHAAEVPFLATRRTYVPRGRRALSGSGLLFALGEVYWPVKRHAVDVVLHEGDHIETPLGLLTVVSTPGHTPGHISFFQEREGWLFSGDALLNIIPWVRRTGLSLPMPIFTSDMQAAHRSVRKLAELEPSALLAGHGYPHMDGTAAALKEFVKRLPE